jgi:hypothetical protein
MSKLTQTWFTQIRQLEIGEAIFLRAANKKEQTEIANEVEKEKEIFARLDPEHASQLFVNKVLKNLKQWVVVERKYRAPFTAIFKSASGEMSKISVDPDRHRQIGLMLKDKRSREEIEEALNGLNEGEIKEFFPEEVNK